MYANNASVSSIKILKIKESHRIRHTLGDRLDDKTSSQNCHYVIIRLKDFHVLFNLSAKNHFSLSLSMPQFTITFLRKIKRGDGFSDLSAEI